MGFEAGKPVEGKKLYTGLGDVEIVLVNPTLAELQAKGVNFKEEPVYTSVADAGHKKVRLDIWTNHPIVGLQKVVFFLEDYSKDSAAGNKQYINDFGQSTWGKTEEDVMARLKWFDSKGIRLAKSGEPELVDFIKNLLSIGKDTEAGIDKISKLFNGDVSELKDIFAKFNDRKVQILYMVKEFSGEWYQNIYARYFSRAGSKSTGYWNKHFTGSTSTPIFQDSYLLKEFDPLTYATPSVDKGAEGDPWA
jgi:hypothetical protein